MTASLTPAPTDADEKAPSGPLEISTEKYGVLSADIERLTVREHRVVRTVLGFRTTREVMEEVAAMNLEGVCATAAVLLARDAEGVEVTDVYRHLCDTVTMGDLTQVELEDTEADPH